MKRTGGPGRKTRGKLRKNVRDRGKLSIRRYFQKFEIGDKVILKAEPAVQRGMYHPRFHGGVGVIVGKTVKCYDVKIKDRNKEKLLKVHSIHLKRA